MCAINGFNFHDDTLIRKMNQATKHRGPDDTGVFFHEDISLGHNRLSILDTSYAGHQPMKSHDGGVAISYNGEIYNFQELRRELFGHDFKTQCDTEVILAAYEKWGKECVKKFDGIFAFAIWDSEKQVLLLARDPLGVKPLYYYWDGKKLIFSSEIKAILEHGISRALDREAFAYYMRVLYVPEPLTMFRSVRKLPKGHLGVLKDGIFTVESFVGDRRKPEKIREPYSRRMEIVRNTVAKSVSLQLVSDRPLGVYLSGGIDSSIVLDCMSRERGNIDTFSVGFNLESSEEAEKFNADFNLARRTAKHYGTRHHEVQVSPGEIVPLFKEAVRHMDEPVSNATLIPMLKLSRYTKGEGVDVVLTGDGGDELFGGYERYRLSLLASAYQSTIPEFFRKLLSRANERLLKLNTDSGVERFALFHFQKEPLLRRIVTPEYLQNGKTEEFFEKTFFNEDTGESFEEIFMRTDRASWLPDESLVRIDKMSMASALEARVPLLGRNVVELSERLPRKDKVDLFRTKKILKDAFRGRIPDFLLDQPKRGWFSPAAKWLRHEEVYAFAKEVLRPLYYEPTKKLFRWEQVEKILLDHKEKREYNLVVLWSLLTFQLWAKEYQVEAEIF